MKRHVLQPRPDWQTRVEKIGLTYHTHAEVPYWDESACYEFSLAEILEIERATKELHGLCIEAAGRIVEKGEWDLLAIPDTLVPLIERSWERDDFSLYGRFDLAYDGSGPPKMLEYNADTPTSLVEAAVAQWHWLQEVRPGCDQFNSLHERLVDAWRRMAPSEVLFAGVDDVAEDAQTLVYLCDTCIQAGITTQLHAIGDLGWHHGAPGFVDLSRRRVHHVFKLYPWEWMAHEEFGPMLASDTVTWVEPPWKMLLSNKGLLPVLWEMFPGHPNLLPAYFTPEALGVDYVKKPLLSREGANVTLYSAGVACESTPGDYGEEGHVFQALAPLRAHQGNWPVLGSWIVDHEAAGLGIREDVSRITGNLSRFVPHFITQP